MRNFLFLGDSITDCGRLFLPEKNGLGNGYVSLLAERIYEKWPFASITNKGVDGFTTGALLRRLVSFVSGSDADFICLLIGINDIGAAVHTGQIVFETAPDSPVPEPTAETLAVFTSQFEKNYGHLLSSFRFLTDARILCAAPFIFPCPQSHLLQIPLVYAVQEIIRSIANRYQTDFLPLHDTLNAAADKQGVDRITTDGIHLTGYGHQLLAEELRPYFDL